MCVKLPREEDSLKRRRLERERDADPLVTVMDHDGARLRAGDMALDGGLTVTRAFIALARARSSHLRDHQLHTDSGRSPR